jgi:hypothetical protein
MKNSYDFQGKTFYTESPRAITKVHVRGIHYGPVKLQVITGGN